MLTILTTINTIEPVQTTIASIERLDELVTIVQETDRSEDLKMISVENGKIFVPLDWYDLEPPYLFPSCVLSKENLLALVFYKLGNHQSAFKYLSEDSALYHHLLIATHLQFGYEITDEMLAFCKKTSLHNYAIASYYGAIQNPLKQELLKSTFEEAIEKAKNDEVKVFTSKHYINLLLDAGELKNAKALVTALRVNAISEEACAAMDTHLAAILMTELKLPYDQNELNHLHELQLRTIAYFESKGLDVQAGLLLIEAAEVANFKEDFIASKELINKAIQYFKQVDLPEFLGEAGLKKAVLLYTWSKNGSPQYYKAAINAFQDVLKIFKRDTHPQKFADIHHNLALIYSEIPVGTEEKPMWTAFCASSFKEALAFYTKRTYPYEHAMVSHNYATALMHFPPAKIHNNIKKAAGLFEKALEIRTAIKYPFERALTLLNKLELGWLTHNENTEDEHRNYEEMTAMVKEIKGLVNDKELLAKAQEHLTELEKVKSLI